MVGEEFIEAGGEEKEWIKTLRSVLDELGLSYEVEENIRIHVGDIIVQVGELEEEKGYYVTVSLTLPSKEASSSEVEYFTSMYRSALNIILRLSGEIKYDLDTSLPDYPVLHITRKYSDADKMVKDLKEALSGVAESTTASSEG